MQCSPINLPPGLKALKDGISGRSEALWALEKSNLSVFGNKFNDCWHLCLPGPVWSWGPGMTAAYYICDAS